MSTKLFHSVFGELINATSCSLSPTKEPDSTHRDSNLKGTPRFYLTNVSASTYRRLFPLTIDNSSRQCMNIRQYPNNIHPKLRVFR